MAREIIIGIYQITNKINNKKYIGQSINIYDRWMIHKKELRGNYHCNAHLQNAWNKYGEDNFQFDTLCSCENINELNIVEEKYIDEYNLCDDRYGYNIRSGGNNSKMTDSSREKLKQAITDIRGVKLYQLNLNGDVIHIFPSVAEASRLFIDGNVRTLHNAIKRGHIYKDFIWVREEDFINKNYNIEEMVKSSKPKLKDQRIVQMTLDFSVIKIWSKTSEIEKELNMNTTYITSVCRGRRFSTYGYTWIRYIDYEKGITSKFKSTKTEAIKYGFVDRVVTDIDEIL